MMSLHSRAKLVKNVSFLEFESSRQKHVFYSMMVLLFEFSRQNYLSFRLRFENGTFLSNFKLL